LTECHSRRECLCAEKGEKTMTKNEEMLTAITKAATFETSDRGCNLLIAMRELLSSLNTHEDSRGYLVSHEELRDSFLTLFQMWLGETGYKVPTVEAKTLDDAFTAIYAVSAVYGVPA
jgi:hypothetical protein